MIEVYGLGRDLIAVAGEHLENEFITHDVLGNYLAFSDGSLISIRNTEKIWNLDVITEGRSYIALEKSTDISTISDKVFLGDDIRWVTFGPHLTKRDPL